MSVTTQANSFARLVVINETAYEDTMSATEYAWPDAQAGDEMDYYLNIGAFLAAVNDSGSTVDVDIAPSGSGEIVASNLTAVQNLIGVRLTGGVSSRAYQVRFSVTTAAGREKQWIVNLKISEDTMTWPVTCPPSESFGPSPPLSGVFTPGNSPITVAAFGTTQGTATPIPVGNVFVNSGTGGVIAPDQSTFNGQTMYVTNGTDTPFNFYPAVGNTIQAGATTLAVNAPFPVYTNIAVSITEAGTLLVVT